MIKTLGILGGGQLGRMAAIEAAKLGIKTIILCPSKDCPAAQVAAKHICADYTDESALHAFMDEVDVVTYEFENIPERALKIIQKQRSVYPRKDLLEIAQNRIREKTWLNENGFATARWKTVKTPFEVFQTMKIFHIDQCILKTAEQGYDGKGQAFIQNESQVAEIWDTLDHSFDIILEEVIPFTHELSVIVARDKKGRTGCYAPSLNEHRNHILYKTTAPAPLPSDILAQAEEVARSMAEKILLIGVMGIEFFLTENGDLLINEIAPRPHNSGHWTIDACYCNQFAQQVRAVCGLPLGSFHHHHNAEMVNLLGQDALTAYEHLHEEHSFVHLYGKDDAKDGRKMGHITRLMPLRD